MIQSIGRLVQQVITTTTLSVSILLFSPWLLLLLVVGVIPAFLGESHFAFLGYAKNFRQTPVRRQLDYLRVLGGSREAAKELKLFGLRQFLIRRFTLLSNEIYEENVGLARRKLIAGTLLSVIGTAGYYAAYVYVVWRTVTGAITIGSLTFLSGAILQASNNIQQMFSTLSSIADQALFLTDLLAFFEMKPTIRSKPNALAAPRPIRRGFEFRNVSFRYPGGGRMVLENFNFFLHTRERVALIGENGQGKTTIVKLMTRLYDPVEGQVLLDGIDLREYSLEDLYKEIGVIFQDFMYDLGWFGAYGFYESADFSKGQRFLRAPRFQLVHCWMAHHQGMSLLSLANFLSDNIVQRWFHSDRRVQATELLLHEKPVAHVRSEDLAPGHAAA